MPGERTRNLRHELRTPVNHIVGYSDLLLEEPGIEPALSAALSDVRRHAQESLTAIASIVEDDPVAVAGALTSLRATVAEIARALETAVANSNDAAAEDIQRIGSAVAVLQALVADLAERGTGGGIHARC